MEASIDQHGVRIVLKLVVLHGHSDKKQGKLFNSSKHLRLDLVCGQALAHEVHIGLMQIVRGHEVHFKLEQAEEFLLSRQNLLLCEGSM